MLCCAATNANFSLLQFDSSTSDCAFEGFCEANDFFAKQRIFLGGNRASRDPGRRNGGVMRNPNYTYADTRQPSPYDEGQRESPHLSIQPLSLNANKGSDPSQKGGGGSLEVEALPRPFP